MHTPILQAEAVAAITWITDLIYSLDEESTGLDYIQQSLERALIRLSNETGAKEWYVDVDADKKSSSVKSAIK